MENINYEFVTDMALEMANTIKQNKPAIRNLMSEFELVDKLYPFGVTKYQWETLPMVGALANCLMNVADAKDDEDFITHIRILAQLAIVCYSACRAAEGVEETNEGCNAGENSADGKQDTER